MSEAMALVAMRLADMGKIHPYQDNSRVCGECGERVGIYPSGQSALRMNPGMRIICAPCATRERETVPPDTIEIQPAASWDEILQETKDSKPVGKA